MRLDAGHVDTMCGLGHESMCTSSHCVAAHGAPGIISVGQLLGRTRPWTCGQCFDSDCTGCLGHLQALWHIFVLTHPSARQKRLNDVHRAPPAELQYFGSAIPSGLYQLNLGLLSF